MAETPRAATPLAVAMDEQESAENLIDDQTPETKASGAEEVLEQVSSAASDEPLVNLNNEPLVPEPAPVDEISSDRPGDDQLPPPSQPEIAEEPSMPEVTPAVEKYEQDVATGIASVQPPELDGETEDAVPDSAITEPLPASIVEATATDFAEAAPVHHGETKESDDVAESTDIPVESVAEEQKPTSVEVEKQPEVVSEPSDTAESPTDPTLSPLTPIDETLDENVIPAIDAAQQGESTSTEPSSTVPETVDNPTKETEGDAKQPRRCVIM